MKNSEKFDIRYSKINLVFEFTEATKMPKNKVSAIRGGMGEMLLNNIACRIEIVMFVNSKKIVLYQEYFIIH